MKFLVTFFLLFDIALATNNDNTPFNQLPLLMSHDAASGYLQRDKVVADWTITQSDGLVEQMECGSRSFDYRPYLLENG